MVSRREERSRGLNRFSSPEKKPADDSACLIDLNVITEMEMLTIIIFI